MARRKGSKNKGTLIREIRQRRPDAPLLENLEYDTLSGLHQLVIEGQSISWPTSKNEESKMASDKLTKEMSDILFDAGFSRLMELKNESKDDKIPTNVLDLLTQVYFMKKTSDARLVVRRAIDLYEAKQSGRV